MNKKRLLKKIKEKEWSMGNGQCPECGAVHEGWFGHPTCEDPAEIGHKRDCIYANMIIHLDGHCIFKGKSRFVGKKRVRESLIGQHTRICGINEPPDELELEAMKANKKINDEIFGNFGEQMYDSFVNYVKDKQNE